MSFINYSSREINCKIVYYGPGLCGKTTNLQYIYARTNPDAKGRIADTAVEEVIGMISTLETLPSVRPLMDLLRAAPRRVQRLFVRGEA